MALGKTGPGTCGVGNPNCSSCEGTPTTNATENQRENTPTSLPRGGENERLDRTDIMETTRLTQRTLTGTAPVETKCHCGKVCKNIKGLRIHQAKNTACKRLLAQKQRARDPLGETQKDDSQETHHSTNDLNVPVQTADSSETASASQTDEPMSQHEADPPQPQEPEPPDASQSQIPKKTERKPRVK